MIEAIITKTAVRTETVLSRAIRRLSARLPSVRPSPAVSPYL